MADRLMVRPDSLATAAYVEELRLLLADALASRATLVGSIARVVDAGGLSIARALRSVGRRHRENLLGSQDALDALRPPHNCQPCHQAAARWLAELVLTCDALTRAGLTPDAHWAGQINERLARARIHATAFNAELARVVSQARPAGRPSTPFRERTRPGWRRAA